MNVVSIPNGAFLENCYLVIDEAARQCVIVDPGEDAGLILGQVAATDARPVAVWLTHAHLDHVLGVGRVAAETGAPVFLHPDDRALYDHVPQQAEAFGLRAAGVPPPPPDRAFAHGDEVRVGMLRFSVRHTPGHSPGSVCLVGQGVVFAGDVLFQGSIGRTDLPGGSMDTLLRSIRDVLFSFPGDTVVWSGHGDQTTIGREQGSNPFLV